MTIKIEKFRSEVSLFYEAACFIRNTVFVEEQNVPKELELDEYEAVSTFYLLFFEGKPVATARWRETEKGVKLERFAVLKDFRNQKLGYVILKRVLEDVVPLKKEIYLHAQIDAFNFYKRNGFEPIGEKFVEAGIVHYLMKFSG